MKKMKFSLNLSHDASDRTRWVLLIIFAVMVVVLGGGSRSDVASMPLLRSIAALFCFVAIAMTPISSLRVVSAPLLFLGALGGWMALQLVPLPSEVWSNLPQRNLIFAIDQLLGRPEAWRPISLTPSSTLNSLLALTVPVAAFLMAAWISPGDRRMLWWFIWAIGISSSAMALVQFMSGPNSPAYLYRITNQGSLVGFFANRNHHAFILSIGILAASWLIVDELARKGRRRAVVPVLSSSIVIFLLLLLVGGSRLGLICGILAVVVGYAAIRWGLKFRHKPLNQISSRRPQRNSAVMSVLANIAPIGIFAGVIAVASLSGRADSITRLVAGDGAAEMRLAALDTVVKLLETQWIFGSGFGSFSKVFQIVEPDSLLQPSYFNHAHNDWLQYPLEGGIPAVLILVAVLLWIVVTLASWARSREWAGIAMIEICMLAASIVLVMIGSLVDYPLRTPTIMMAVSFLLIILAKGRAASIRPRQVH